MEKLLLSEVNRINVLMGLSLLNEATGNPLLGIVKKLGKNLEKEILAITGEQLNNLSSAGVSKILKSKSPVFKPLILSVYKELIPGMTKVAFNAKTFDELVNELALQGVSQSNIKSLLKRAGDEWGEPRGGFPPNPKLGTSKPATSKPQIPIDDELQDAALEAVDGNTDELVDEFIKKIKQSGGQVSRGKVEEIKEAMRLLNTQIKATYDKMVGGVKGDIEEYLNSHPDVKSLIEKWDKIPPVKRKEIIKQLNKEMEAAFGDWVVGMRLSPTKKELLKTFFYNFWWKKGVMLNMNPKDLSGWVQWYFKSVTAAMVYFTLAELQDCLYLDGPCINLLTDLKKNLSHSVLPFLGAIEGSFVLGKTTLERIGTGWKSWTSPEQREGGTFKNELSIDESKDFVENKGGITNYLPPNFSLSSSSIEYLPVSGSPSEVDVLIDGQRILTLEKVLSPGLQSGDAVIYKIRVKQ